MCYSSPSPTTFTARQGPASNTWLPPAEARTINPSSRQLSSSALPLFSRTLAFSIIKQSHSLYSYCNSNNWGDRKKTKGTSLIFYFFLSFRFFGGEYGVNGRNVGRDAEVSTTLSRRACLNIGCSFILFFSITVFLCFSCSDMSGNGLIQQSHMIEV